MKVICNGCQQPLAAPGALLFSAPNADQEVMKLHICVKCYELVIARLHDIARIARS